MRESGTPRLEFFFKVIGVQLQGKVTVLKEVGRGSWKEVSECARGTVMESAGSIKGTEGQSWKVLGYLGRLC